VYTANSGRSASYGNIVGTKSKKTKVVIGGRDEKRVIPGGYYHYMARTTVIYLAKVGYFHLIEKVLPDR
jgi:hypothetical protein